MKCSSCGGQMEYAEGHYRCKYCGAIMLKIIDAKIDADVEHLDAEEFERKLEESKRSFLIRVDEELKVVDAKTAIVNKRLQNAKKSLEGRNYERVFGDLEGVMDDVLAAVRLRFLASVKVKDEYELSLCKFDIKNDWYRKFVSQCEDEETRRSYEKIAEICSLNEALDKELEGELKVIREMMSVGLKEEPLAYAKQICSKYPQLCKSWGEYASVKCQLDPDYNCTADLEIMKKCPDYKWDFVPIPVRLRREQVIRREEQNRKICEEKIRAEALEKTQLDERLNKNLEEYKKAKKTFIWYSVLRDVFLFLIFAGGLMIVYAGMKGLEELEPLLALGMFLQIGGVIVSFICIGPVWESKKECKAILSYLEPYYDYRNTVCAAFKKLKKILALLTIVFVLIALVGLALMVFGLTKV